MNLSDAGAQFIAGWEGLRLKPYDDGAGWCTVGIGHVLHAGACTPADKTITTDEAMRLFRGDVARFETGVSQLVTVPLNQNQFDALVSFAFNVGLAALKGSTLRRRLNAGDYACVPAELAKWNKGGGIVLAGLSRRRRAEGELFATPIQEGSFHVDNPKGQGYWLVTADGGVFNFGDAGFYGSLGGVTLAAPIVSLLPTPTGEGYWLVARDGGVFAFGDATYLGGLGGRKLNAPVVGAAVLP